MLTLSGVYLPNWIDIKKKYKKSFLFIERRYKITKKKFQLIIFYPWLWVCQVDAPFIHLTLWLAFGFDFSSISSLSLSLSLSLFNPTPSYNPVFQQTEITTIECYPNIISCDTHLLSTLLYTSKRERSIIPFFHPAIWWYKPRSSSFT